MSLNLVPKQTYTSNTREVKGAPSVPGIHDTLRTNLSLAPETFSSSSKAFNSSRSSDHAPCLKSKHPLEARLANWQATQDSLKMEMLRRTFGIAEPVRRGMELRIASEGEWRPHVLGGSANVHTDILAGRETDISWEDIFNGDDFRDLPDIHTEMEARLRMN